MSQAVADRDAVASGRTMVCVHAAGVSFRAPETCLSAVKRSCPAVCGACNAYSMFSGFPILAISPVQMWHAHSRAWYHLSCVAETCSCFSLTPHPHVRLWQANTLAWRRPTCAAVACSYSSLAVLRACSSRSSSAGTPEPSPPKGLPCWAASVSHRLLPPPA